MTQPVPDGCPLTSREYETLLGIADGKSKQQIANDAGVTVSTIRSQLHSAYQRLNVNDATQAVITGLKAGWIHYHQNTAISPTLMLTEEQWRRRDEIGIARRIYIFALDLHIRATDDDERHATWQIMRRTAHDAGIPTSSRPDRRGDLVETLIAHMRRRHATA